MKIDDMANSSGDLHQNTKELGADFRRYLERGKFNDEMTRILLKLYSEREWPQNPNEYVCRKLADSCKLIIVEDQKNELSTAKNKIKELESTISKLKDDLRKYEKSSKKHKE